MTRTGSCKIPLVSQPNRTMRGNDDVKAVALELIFITHTACPSWKGKINVECTEWSLIASSGHFLKLRFDYRVISIARYERRWACVVPAPTDSHPERLRINAGESSYKPRQPMPILFS